MSSQIVLTKPQEAVLFALEQRRQELQTEHVELTQAMQDLGEHYAHLAGLVGDGQYQTILSMRNQSVVQFTPTDEQEAEHDDDQ